MRTPSAAARASAALAALLVLTRDRPRSAGWVRPRGGRGGGAHPNGVADAAAAVAAPVRRPRPTAAASAFLARERRPPSSVGSGPRGSGGAGGGRIGPPSSPSRSRSSSPPATASRAGGGRRYPARSDDPAPGFRRQEGGGSARSSRTRFNFRLFEHDEEEVPAWVRSLLRWPLQPSLPKLMHMPPLTVEEEREALERAREEEEEKADAETDSAAANAPVANQVPVPLASLINVEALLMASGEEILDGAEEFEPYSGSVVNSGQSEAQATLPDLPNITGGENQTAAGPIALLPPLEELGNWDRLVRSLQTSVSGLTTGAARAAAAEGVLREVTSRISAFLDGTSAALSPAAVQDLVVRASNALAIDENAVGFRAAADDVVRAAERLARERGLDVSDAAERARETTRYTEELLRVANGVLVSGYVQGDGRGAAGVARSLKEREETSRVLSEEERRGIVPGVTTRSGTEKAAPPPVPTDALYSRPLFSDFPTARAISPGGDHRRAVEKAAEMAVLAGAVYQNTVEETQRAGHALVARGMAADVAWMVSDSVGYEHDFRDRGATGGGSDTADGAGHGRGGPILIRTVTIRGFDATDEGTDRERLLNRICSASPVPVGNTGVSVHRGLLSVARKVYNDIMEYVDLVGPNHRVVLNGHSIGGSLSVLILMLMVEKRGVDFVRDKVLRVFTFGSPPVSMLTKDLPQTNGRAGTNGEAAAPAVTGQKPKKDAYPFSLEGLMDRGGANGAGKTGEGPARVRGEEYDCSVLGVLGLPADMVYGYVQPWDPIIRLFSSIDALYPLVGDLGEDGKTLFASGPQRSLRPITRAIIESWDGWSRFRDNYGPTGDQNFVHAGVQHIILPEPVRYLTDRLVSVNIAIPPVDAVVRISSGELLPGLERTYPLDVFSISFVPVALRSFVHHFYPAYVDAFVEFASGSKKKKGRKEVGRERGEKKDGTLAVSARDIDVDADAVVTDDVIKRGKAPGEVSAHASEGADPVRRDGMKAGLPGMEWAEASAQWILGGNRVLGTEEKS